jgi:hypothetical protein
VKKLLLLLSLFIMSCTTRTATEEKKKETSVAPDLDRQSVVAVLRCVNEQSSAACSLLGEGSITLSDGSSSESGHFELKSKRLLNPHEPQRIDSLSMVVTGPFGITGAKFLGAPQEYQFYDAIDGEKYRGRPDPKTLQNLTGMKGLSIQALSDVVYGLPPNGTELAPGDSAIVRSESDYRQVLYIYRAATHTTEAITLAGKLPLTPTEKVKLTIIQYDRWNTYLLDRSTVKPDITITYDGLFEKKDFTLPNFIKATSGSTTLEIEYTGATQNPTDLTVKIKMPN